MENGVNSFVDNWVSGRETTGALLKYFAFDSSGLEFYLAIAAFILLCLSLRMFLKNLKAYAVVKKGRDSGHFSGFSVAAEKLRRFYALFAWGMMSLSFMFSVLLYLP